MAHTKRELLHTVADKLGGEPGVRLRAMLRAPTPFDDMLDRPIDEAEYAAQLMQLLTDLSPALARLERGDLDTSGTWGLAN